VWGPDWPFLSAAARIEYGPLLALFQRLVHDDANRRAIQWDAQHHLASAQAERNSIRTRRGLQRPKRVRFVL
jgi:hypothetical protein